MEYRARDIMNPNVITVPVTMDLRDLAKMFLERGITGAPVVETDGRLAGVISQTDLVYYNLMRGDELVMDSSFYQSARFEGHRLPQGFQVEDFNSGVVGDVMTPVVHAVKEAASLDSIARLMTREHIHRVIVCRGRKIAGIISALDVLRCHRQVTGAERRSPVAKRGKAGRVVKKSPAKGKKAGARKVSKNGAGKRRVR